MTSTGLNKKQDLCKAGHSLIDSQFSPKLKPGGGWIYKLGSLKLEGRAEHGDCLLVCGHLRSCRSTRL